MSPSNLGHRKTCLDGSDVPTGTVTQYPPDKQNFLHFKGVFFYWQSTGLIISREKDHKKKKNTHTHTLVYFLYYFLICFHIFSNWGMVLPPEGQHPCSPHPSRWCLTINGPDVFKLKQICIVDRRVDLGRWWPSINGLDGDCMHAVPAPRILYFHTLFKHFNTFVKLHDLDWF